MKVDRQKFIDAINYIKSIDAVSFDELDFSDFPAKNNVSEDMAKEFKFTGLLNSGFIKMYLLDDENYKV